MKHLIIMKASTWFGDKRERGFIIATKHNIFEAGFHVPTLPAIDFDFEDEYFIAINLGLLTLGLTKRNIKI